MPPSSQPKHRDENLIVSDNFDEVMKELASGSLSENVEKIWNIGGAEIYKMALEKGYVDRLLVTKIQKDLHCDVFLKGVDWDHFLEDLSERSDLMAKNDLVFSFHTYRYVD
ncbi:hypothetical protein Q1695_015285 [Nippostrongylus brasiliensis]|nr:hypothetical protein Q1695_015285 [Nippostrongylus brasiliensis]